MIRHLGHLFLKMSPEDIRKWNVTSLETLKALLKVSKGHEMSAQVTVWLGGEGGCGMRLGGAGGGVGAKPEVGRAWGRGHSLRLCWWWRDTSLPAIRLLSGPSHRWPP